MPISINIVTTRTQIIDSQGVNGFGQLIIRPSRQFTYNDGTDTITVTDKAVMANVRDGRLIAPLSLAPNMNALNSPVTYYIVNGVLNGGNIQTIYWQLSHDGMNAERTIEFGDVTTQFNFNAGGTTGVQELRQQSNPFPQYVLRSDSVITST